jgi:hypothetical protein
MAMSTSISAQRAQATHDAAMSIIEKEARDRAAKTEHLRQLRLAAEAEAKPAGPAAAPRMVMRAKASLPRKAARPSPVKKAS